MSPFFTREAGVGTVVYLGEVEGTFRSARPDSREAADHQCRQRDHADLRPAARARAQRRPWPTSSMSTASAPRRRFSSATPAGGWQRRHPSAIARTSASRSKKGRIAPKDLDKLCPDWREREAFISGPPGLLDGMTSHWDSEGVRERLSIEHFQPFLGDGGEAGLGEGGTVRFRVTDFEAECDGQTSILVGGEEAGGQLTYGCRHGRLPHLHLQAREREGQGHAHRRRPRRAGRDDPDLHQRARGRGRGRRGHVVIRGTPARSKG